MTKFGKVTCGEGRISKVSATPEHKGAGPECLYNLILSDQMRQSNAYWDGSVSRESATPSHFKGQCPSAPKFRGSSLIVPTPFDVEYHPKYVMVPQ